MKSKKDIIPEIIEQSCKIMKDKDDNRVIILCDAPGYYNLNAWIDSISNECFDIERNEFITTNFDDCVISCTINAFINLIVDVFDHYKRNKKLLQIPRLFVDIFNSDKYQRIVEAIQRSRDMSDFEDLKNRIDNNTYEILTQDDCCHMSDDSKFAHIVVSMEIITDSMCANKLELCKVFNNADRYNENIITWMYTSYLDCKFIRPGEITVGSPIDEEWFELCRKAYELHHNLIIDNQPTNVAKSFLPSSSVKKIQFGASLGEWNAFFKYARMANVGHLCKNMSQLLVMMCNMFNAEHIPHEMNKAIADLKTDLDLYEWLPF